MAMKFKKICPVCGRSFETNNELYQYCGPECRRSARRAWDRERKRKERESASIRRRVAREPFEQARRAEAEERSARSREDFERRCAEGDPHALLIREKGEHGTHSHRYWELFAECSIEEAETARKTSRTTVNGISVYEDDFAGLVMESIRERGQIIIESRRR